MTIHRFLRGNKLVLLDKGILIVSLLCGSAAVPLWSMGQIANPAAQPIPVATPAPTGTSNSSYPASGEDSTLEEALEKLPKITFRHPREYSIRELVRHINDFTYTYSYETTELDAEGRPWTRTVLESLHPYQFTVDLDSTVVYTAAGSTEFRPGGAWGDTTPVMMRRIPGLYEKFVSHTKFNVSAGDYSICQLLEKMSIVIDFRDHTETGGANARDRITIKPRVAERRLVIVGHGVTGTVAWRERTESFPRHRFDWRDIAVPSSRELDVVFRPASVTRTEVEIPLPDAIITTRYPVPGPDATIDILGVEGKIVYSPEVYDEHIAPPLGTRPSFSRMIQVGRSPSRAGIRPEALASILRRHPDAGRIEWFAGPDTLERDLSLLAESNQVLRLPVVLHLPDRTPVPEKVAGYLAGIHGQVKRPTDE